MGAPHDSLGNKKYGVLLLVPIHPHIGTVTVPTVHVGCLERRLTGAEQRHSSDLGVGSEPSKHSDSP